jgi:hypothetical protein
VLLAAAAEDRLADLKTGIPDLTDDFIKDQLGLPSDYGLDEYYMHSVVQSLLYPSKAARVDSENECMKISDLVNKDSASTIVRGFISAQFKDRHKSDCRKKYVTEHTILKDELVSSLMAAPNRQAIIRLFKEGVSRGQRNFRIATFISFGYMDLSLKLKDTTLPCACRADLIEIFLLCIDQETDESVYNGGRATFVPNIAEFEAAFVECACEGWQRGRILKGSKQTDHK